LDASGALELGLADACIDAERLGEAWDGLAQLDWNQTDPLAAFFAMFSIAAHADSMRPRDLIDHYFSKPSVGDMVKALEADGGEWSQHTAAILRKRSPLMLHVALEQVRRARTMTLADDLRMERDIVRHCFNTLHMGRTGGASETVEGIRALAVDKDHTPQWHPARIEDVTPEQVAPFFVSPWPAWAHPLRGLE
jgi:enoyl-CoA hydratase